MRRALNDLAIVVPEWLRAHAPAEWFERYVERFEDYHLPQDNTKRDALMRTIGADGYQLVMWLYADEHLNVLCRAPALEALRRIWIQNFYQPDGQVHWRRAGNLPPTPLTLV